MATLWISNFFLVQFYFQSMHEVFMPCYRNKDFWATEFLCKCCKGGWRVHVHMLCFEVSVYLYVFTGVEYDWYCLTGLCLKLFYNVVFLLGQMLTLLPELCSWSCKDTRTHDPQNFTLCISINASIVGLIHTLYLFRPLLKKCFSKQLDLIHSVYYFKKTHEQRGALLKLRREGTMGQVAEWEGRERARPTSKYILHPATGEMQLIIC